MNLRDLTPKTSSQTMGKLLESYFQKKTRFTSLTEGAARSMLTKVNTLIKEYKSTAKRHTSEQDKTYLSLMFMQEGLQKRISELAQPGKSALNPNSPEAKALVNPIKKATAGSQVTGKDAQGLAGAALLNKKPNAPKDPVADGILKKAVQGQGVSGEEAKKLSSLATNEGIEDRLEAAREKAAAKGKKVNDAPASKGDRKGQFHAGKAYGGSKQQDKEEVVDEGEGQRQVAKAKNAINRAEKGLKRAGVGGDGKQLDTVKKGLTAKGLKNKGWKHDAEAASTQRVAAKGEMKTSGGKYGYGKGVYESSESVQESFNRMYHSFLAEGADVDQAQVVLAAQDMVDSVQDMLEKVGKMKIDELYPLSDSIKAALGTDKSGAFSQAVDTTLQTILDALQNARQELSNAVGALTGEEMAPDFAANVGDDGSEDAAADLGLGDEGDMGAEEGGDDAADLGLTPDAEAEPLGRERRA